MKISPNSRREGFSIEQVLHKWKNKVKKIINSKPDLRIFLSKISVLLQNLVKVLNVYIDVIVYKDI